MTKRDRDQRTHVCPAIQCQRTTRGLLCRKHTPMVHPEDRANLRELHRRLREDSWTNQNAWNEAWRRVLAMIAAKEGRGLIAMTVSAR